MSFNKFEFRVTVFDVFRGAVYVFSPCLYRGVVLLIGGTVFYGLFKGFGVVVALTITALAGLVGGVLRLRSWRTERALWARAKADDIERLNDAIRSATNGLPALRSAVERFSAAPGDYLINAERAEVARSVTATLGRMLAMVKLSASPKTCEEAPDDALVRELGDLRRVDLERLLVGELAWAPNYNSKVVGEMIDGFTMGELRRWERLVRVLTS